VGGTVSAALFFTGVDPREVIANLDRDEEGFVLHDAWQDIQAQLAPVSPEGYGGSLGSVSQGSAARTSIGNRARSPRRGRV
jgi:hypothetical protein